MHQPLVPQWPRSLSMQIAWPRREKNPGVDLWIHGLLRADLTIGEPVSFWGT